MEQLIVVVSELVVVTVNGPLIVFNIIANIFYACCLIFSQRRRQRLKQPLKTLLGVLVACSIMYGTSLIVLYGVVRENPRFHVVIVSWMILMFFVHNIMTCCVWLNFCYYIQIVPSQRVFLIWVKKNIRSVIFIIIIFDGMLFFFDTIITVGLSFSKTRYINSTWSVYSVELQIISCVCFILIRLHMTLCLFIMAISSVSTFKYLYKHIQSVAQGGCFSKKRLQSQIRVTITGICQGVLYFIYDTVYLVEACAFIFAPQLVVSSWITLTATTLFMTGTNINLGIGQAIFRSTMGDVWRKLKALFGLGITANDVKVHSSQLISGETSPTVEAQTTL